MEEHKKEQRTGANKYIELVISTGEGQHNHVAWASIPQFKKDPEVIVWGNRTFLALGHKDRYVEVCAYTVASVMIPSRAFS